MLELIDTCPLGLWSTVVSGALVANPAPFLLDRSRGPHGTLRGHIARANPVWQDHSRQIASLVTFMGPQAYVTPNGYASKRVHGKVVPTWNYMMVQVRGMPRVVEDRDEVLQIVAALTERHEAGQPAPWHLADAPGDYIDKMLGAIVGIEIPIDQLEGKFKLSQNRSQADRSGTIAELRSRDETAADEMADRIERFQP